MSVEMPKELRGPTRVHRIQFRLAYALGWIVAVVGPAVLSLIMLRRARVD